MKTPLDSEPLRFGYQWRFCIIPVFMRLGALGITGRQAWLERFPVSYVVFGILRLNMYIILEFII